MSWPPRWDKPHFKEPGPPAKVVRAKKRLTLKTAEDAQKRAVRKRDRICRFPLCGCGKFKLALHVSHSVHKGMGGDPTGDRSDQRLMVQVCASRHKENRLAIDRGTIRWVPLDAELGADGNIAWEMDTEQGWVRIATETANGQWALLPEERQLLLRLAKMDI